MDTKITPKIHAPGHAWITTITEQNHYRAVMFVASDDGSRIELDRSLTPYDTRFEAALDAKEWAAKTLIDYEPAGTDI